MAEVNSEDVVYDPADIGDGRIVIEAARRYKAHAVGIEADPIRYMWSKFMGVLLGVNKKVEFWGNFFNQTITPATVVTLFLSSRANERLTIKLLKELQPGTRIISYYWIFHGWTPIR